MILLKVGLTLFLVALLAWLYTLGVQRSKVAVYTVALALYGAVLFTVLWVGWGVWILL